MMNFRLLLILMVDVRTQSQDNYEEEVVQINDFFLRRSLRVQDLNQIFFTEID
jgi:hypothetical protein